MLDDDSGVSRRDVLKVAGASVATAEDIGLSSNRQGSGLLDVAASLGLDSSDD